MQRERAESSRAAVVKRRPTGRDKVRRVEQLVARLSGAFVRATVDEIDAEINRSMKRVCLLLGLDRGTVARIDPVNGWSAITHSWARQKARVFPTSLDPNKYLPWHKKQMLAGEIIAYSDLDDLPEEAEIDRETLRPLGPQSAVVLPTRVGGVTFGAVAFDTQHKSRRWSARVVEQFRLVADVFGYALERKRNVAEFVRLQNELSHVSRVATLGELTASMAHELNQPLAAILANTEAAQFHLRSAKPDLEEIGVALQEIADSDRRATEIIKRFRALFKRGEVMKSVFSPGELFDAVLRLMKSESAIRGISLKFDCPPSLPGIIADPIQLQQVLLNLLLNAFDSVCAVENGRREVAICASHPQAGFVQIAVRDAGEGLAPEVLPRVFEPFFTTKPEGMGMGLAVARSIVEALGGRLWAIQNPGGGATFEFTVPAAIGLPPPKRSPEPSDSRAELRLDPRIKLAVIDDDASQRDSLVRLLGSSFQEVRAFASADEYFSPLPKAGAFRAWYQICACQVWTGWGSRMHCAPSRRIYPSSSSPVTRMFVMACRR